MFWLGLALTICGFFACGTYGTAMKAFDEGTAMRDRALACSVFALGFGIAGLGMVVMFR